MKYYILSDNKNEYQLRYLENILVNKDNFLDNLNKIEDNSLVLTNLYFDNEEIKWFNNKDFDVEMDINKVIISKKIILVRYQKVVNGELNLFDIFEFLINMHKNMKFFDYKDREKDNLLKKLQNKETCICIGNGSNQATGKIVDSMDIVARVNTSKIAGYEDIVGNKTDIYYKGSSAGICDKNILENKDCIKFTHNGLWNKQERDWLHGGYYIKINWYKLFRVTKFNYYDNKFINKDRKGLNSSGMTLILTLLSKILLNNLCCKLYTTGYNGYTGKNVQHGKMGYGYDPEKSNPYYFTLKDEEIRYESSTNPGNFAGGIVGANPTERFDLVMLNYDLLVENKIIFDLTK